MKDIHISQLKKHTMKKMYFRAMTWLHSLDDKTRPPKWKPKDQKEGQSLLFLIVTVAIFLSHSL